MQSTPKQTNVTQAQSDPVDIRQTVIQPSTGTLITALFVCVVGYWLKRRYDELAARRKAAVRLQAAISECLDDLSRGGSGKTANVAYEAYAEFMLSIPKTSRRALNLRWRDYIDSKSDNDKVECSLKGLEQFVHNYT